ncbi:type I restriction enzyme R subunit [Arthrobacter sp. 1088]|uniref:DEAD/DEAH box helicase family protein n=1 Tax=Arthrobacter sp. 1088 TaxID=2817768 RepID=UPI00286058EC|nr:DEAD/DEAH box helicase family protein [Arthrobacter sp. 1088]MDR6686222.1 type I restriction enzyme R subunit [Arthrobacter sp. 1088]
MGAVNSNFGFMLAEWPDLAQQARRAEQFARIDPRASVFYARYTVERLVEWLYKVEAALELPYKDDLNALLNEPAFKRLVGGAIGNKFTIIRKAGNNAVHNPVGPTVQGAELVLRELHHVCYWLARNYAKNGSQLPPSLVFDAAVLAPVPKSPVPQQSPEQLQKLQEELKAKDEALAKATAESADLNAQLIQLQAEIAQVKKQNQSVPDQHDYDEALTRRHLIDLDLNEAGWPLSSPEDREFKVDTMPTSSGTLSGIGYVDYVLWGADGLPLAVVEAKRTTKDPHVGKQQAKLYADCLERRFGRRPIIYYTSGYETWIWDDSMYPERTVQGFHTRDQLQLFVNRREIRKPLAEQQIDNSIVERPYQHNAIRAVTEAYENDCERKALVVMATGTGKTRTVVALAKLLQEANWAKRVLFLADRVTLVRQAANAFKTHLPGSGPVILGSGDEADSRIHVATYPTMMNLINQTEGNLGQRKFGVGHYDLIIIDEAHRSIYQKYRAIFQYFDSLLIGLTATPQSEVDRNTYSLFGIEDNVPTFAYELNEAIEAGYLVPPRVIPVPLKFPYEGISYDDLPDSEKEQWDELEWNEDGEIPEFVDPAVVNSWLFNTDTVDKALEVLMTHGHKVAGGDRLGKTIIFAKNNQHADFIAARFDKNYPNYKGHFARVITYQVNYAQALIEEFSTRDGNPHIAISVDMLDTGVDVPEAVNLVFFKMVRSKTKFWQMVGRGTRLCPDLFGPGEDKKDFFIFDICRNAEYFNAGMPGNEGSLGKSLAESTFATRVQLLRLAADLSWDADAPYVADLRKTLKHTVDRLPHDNFLVKPVRKWVERFTHASAWDSLKAEDFSALESDIARLASIGALPDTEEAKRFDYLVLQTELAVLEGRGLAPYCKKIQAVATALQDQPNIPAIAAQLPLLETILDDGEWDSISAEWLEDIRLRLRELVHLIEKRKRNVVYTNFQDELGELEEMELAGASNGTVDLVRYREKTRLYLAQHQQHTTIQRLRRNKQLTALDIAELERILLESGLGSSQDLDRAASDGLGVFVRSLVGLDRDAVEEALSEFVADTTLTAQQLDFLQVLTNHLVENGRVDPAALFDSPYNELAPSGPDVLFGDEGVVKLFGILRSIERHARVS